MLSMSFKVTLQIDFSRPVAAALVTVATKFAKSPPVKALTGSSASRLLILETAYVV